MATYFAYRETIERNGQTEEVYVLRPSFLTSILGTTYGDTEEGCKSLDNHFPITSFETMGGAEERIRNVDNMDNGKAKLVTDRLSFFSLASSFRISSYGSEKIQRMPLGLLEEFNMPEGVSRNELKLPACFP